jgi:hypothetical protein
VRRHEPGATTRLRTGSSFISERLLDDRREHIRLLRDQDGERCTTRRVVCTAGAAAWLPHSKPCDTRMTSDYGNPSSTCRHGWSGALLAPPSNNGTGTMRAGGARSQCPAGEHARHHAPDPLRHAGNAVFELWVMHSALGAGSTSRWRGLVQRGHTTSENHNMWACNASRTLAPPPRMAMCTGTWVGRISSLWRPGMAPRMAMCTSTWVGAGSKPAPTEPAPPQSSR